MTFSFPSILPSLFEGHIFTRKSWLGNDHTKDWFLSLDTNKEELTVYDSAGGFQRYPVTKNTWATADWIHVDDPRLTVKVENLIENEWMVLPEDPYCFANEFEYYQNEDRAIENAKYKAEQGKKNFEIYKRTHFVRFGP